MTKKRNKLPHKSTTPILKKNKDKKKKQQQHKQQQSHTDPNPTPHNNSDINHQITKSHSTIKHKTNIVHSNDDNDKDWIAALAAQVTSEHNHHNNHNKQERIERRNSKRKRREERKNHATSPSRTNRDASMRSPHDDDNNNKRSSNSERQTQSNFNHAQAQALLLNQLSQSITHAVTSLHTQAHIHQSRTLHKPYQSQAHNPIHAKAVTGGSKLTSDIIQPRKRDYGGLGLARPSLVLNLRDESFVPKLEQEFREHVPGFFGKQRTKAMKKQLDGNMLWRRLQQQRNENGVGNKKKQQKTTLPNIKMDGKKLSEMTPDERVEAMIKAGMI